MTFRSVTRVMVVLAATAALAQSAQPGTTPGAPILNQQGPAGRKRPFANKTPDPQGLVAMREQVEDMRSTLSQMRVVLKRMNASAARSKAADSLAKANLDMWQLMVSHLDKELQQLQVALAGREDLEARRAALYKQADAKIEAQAQAARAAQAARFAEAEKNATGTPTPAAAGQRAEQSPAAQTAPAQPSATQLTTEQTSPQSTPDASSPK